MVILFTQLGIKKLALLLVLTVSAGMPDAIRTHDLQSRSLGLYPSELRTHNKNGDPEETRTLDLQRDRLAF